MAIDTFYILLAATAVVSILLGYALGLLKSKTHTHKLEQQNLSLETRLDIERKLHAEKLEQLEFAKEQLSETFIALSAQALRENNEEFLKLAKQNLAQYQVEAKGDLEKKHLAIHSLLKPITDALQKTEQQVHQIEKERKESYGALNKHLLLLAETQQRLHSETKNLVQALRRPEVRGQWGELTLRRLAELAGMVEHCDFDEQVSSSSDGGRSRPDMIVRLPGKREIVVDAKTPLDAYLNAIETSDETEREHQLARHAKQVKDRIRELSSKAYWAQFDNALDFVVLFIPGEQFLTAALDMDRSLVEEGLRNKVILATPTTFVAVLRAIAYGWRQESLAENAEQIRGLGEDLHDRLMTFTEYLSKMGQSLDQSVSHYNKAISSFNSRVLPGARKFRELGIQGKKETVDPKMVDKKSQKDLLDALIE